MCTDFLSNFKKDSHKLEGAIHLFESMLQHLTGALEQVSVLVGGDGGDPPTEMSVSDESVGESCDAMMRAVREWGMSVSGEATLGKYSTAADRLQGLFSELRSSPTRESRSTNGAAGEWLNTHAIRHSIRPIHPTQPHPYTPHSTTSIHPTFNHTHAPPTQYHSHPPTQSHPYTHSITPTHLPTQ